MSNPVTNTDSILNAWNSKDYATLKRLASTPEADFTVLFPDGSNVFHNCGKGKGGTRLIHIVEGFKLGGKKNTKMYDAVNARNKKDETPLYIAAKEQSSSAVRSLLELGADQEMLCKEKTPGEVAESPEVLNLFSGMIVMTTFIAHETFFRDDAEYYRIFKELAKNPQVNFKKTYKNKNVFHHLNKYDRAIVMMRAIFDGYFAGEEQNTSIRPAVNEMSDDKTPLFIAATNGYRPITEMLLGLGADPAIPCQSKSIEDIAVGEAKKAFEAPLNCLQNAEFEVILVRLAARLLNPALIDVESGNNGILLVINNGKEKGESEGEIIKVIKAFLKKDGKIDINHTNKQNDTALSLSVENGYTELTKYLIDNWNPSWSVGSTEDKDTVVHLAASRGEKCESVLKFLLSRKREYAIRPNALGQTPLHLVKTPYSLNTLIQNGASTKLKDTNDSFPKDYAQGNEELADCFDLFEENTSKERKAEIRKKWSLGPDLEKNRMSGYLDTAITVAKVGAPLAIQYGPTFF